MCGFNGAFNLCYTQLKGGDVLPGFPVVKLQFVNPLPDITNVGGHGRPFGCVGGRVVLPVAGKSKDCQ